MHFFGPDVSQSINLMENTLSTASLSSNLTNRDVNLDAVDVFEKMGHLPIPAHIHFVGVDNDSINKFDMPDQTLLCDATDPSKSHCPVDFEDAPCNVADLQDQHDGSINGVWALVDTSAMVTPCAGGQKKIVHSCTALHLKPQHPCPICLKVALDTNQPAIAEGHRFLRCCSPADGQGCQDTHVCHHPSTELS